MLIGAMKCATSSLCAILASHPQVNFSRSREPDFFSDQQQTFDSKAIRRYHQNFELGHEGLWGEGSTTYTKAPYVRSDLVDQIHQYNPKTKFIYVVRNPLDRLISHYMHLYQKGRIKSSLEKALEKHPILFDTGKYASQIEPFINRFGRDQVLLINFDAFARDKTNTVRALCDFLGIDFTQTLPFKGIHLNRSLGGNITPYQFDRWVQHPWAQPLKRWVSPEWVQRMLVKLSNNQTIILKERPQLNADLQHRLRDRYLPELRRLESWTGWDLSSWREPETLGASRESHDHEGSDQ